jgi:hypothetical protein
MRYTAEMGSGAVIYIPRSIKIGSSFKSLGEGESQSDNMAIS